MTSTTLRAQAEQAFRGGQAGATPRDTGRLQTLIVTHQRCGTRTVIVSKLRPVPKAGKSV